MSRTVGLGLATSLPVACAAPVPRAVGQLLTTTLCHAAPIVRLGVSGHPGGLLRPSRAFGFNDLITKRPDPAEWHPTATAVVVLGKYHAGADRRSGGVCLDGHDYEAAVINRANLDGGSPVCGRQILAGMIC